MNGRPVVVCSGSLRRRQLPEMCKTRDVTKFQPVFMLQLQHKRRRSQALHTPCFNFSTAFFMLKLIMRLTQTIENEMKTQTGIITDRYIVYINKHAVEI